MNKPDYMTKTEWNNFLFIMDKGCNVANKNMSKEGWKVLINQFYIDFEFCRIRTINEMKKDLNLKEEFEEYIILLEL